MIARRARLSRFWLLSLALLSLALTGCARTQRALPEPQPEPEPSPFESTSALEEVASACAQGSSRDIALDEVTDTGFSAADLLAYVEGEHDETIRWGMSESASPGPESGERGLLITVERASDQARDFQPDTDVIGHGAHCSAWIEVDVVVTLQSEDGALNDRFEATLYATDSRTAYLHATSDQLDIGGTLTVTHDQPPENIAAAGLHVAMTFSEQGVTGALNVVRTRVVPELNLTWDESFELAYWGRAHCPSYAYSVELDTELSLWEDDAPTTAARAIEAINAASPGTVEWEGGEVTAATFRFMPSEAGACVIGNVYGGDLQSLYVPGQIELRTADGRVDARWPGELGVEGHDGAIVTGWSLNIDYLAMPDGFAETPRQLGFPMASRGELDQLVVSFDMRVIHDERSGRLQLDGYEYTTECDLTDPGCVGSSDLVSLERGMVRP